MLSPTWFVSHRQVDRYRTGQSFYDDGMYESDHRPVFADIRLPGS